MEQIDFLQQLLDDLESEKIKYIMIPCDNQTRAVLLMQALDKKDVRWVDNIRLSLTPSKWNIHEEQTLYIVRRDSTIDGKFGLMYGRSDNFSDFFKDENEYAILPSQAILLF